MPDIDLDALADAGAFVSQEHQEHLAGAFAMRGLAVDPAAQTVSFSGADGGRTAWRAHLVGSASPEEGTWLWGWQNVNGFPDRFVQQSRRIRAFGERHGIAELATPQLELDGALPGRLVRAVKTLTGRTAHVVAPVGPGGTRAWLLVEDPALRLPPPTVARTVGVLMSGIAGDGVADHRRALTAWAEQRSAVLEAGEGGAVRVHVSDGTVRVRFDADDRIAGISSGRGDARPPEPAEDEALQPESTGDPSSAEGERAVSPGEEQPEPRRGWLSRLLGR